MHTMDSNTSNVPAFIVKLWKIVEDNAYDHLICWNNNGRSFIIHDQSCFAKELLPLYFKHNNMASFIRQLNMYGFRKVTNIENSGLRSENDDIEFFHPYFAKGQESLLENIKRKTSLKSSLQISTGKNSIFVGALKHEDMADILSDVENIRGKQESVDNQIANMRKENELLWKEVAVLRHKHLKQQQIVEKLIQFLVSLVHNRGMVGIKRKAQLMINDSENSGSNKVMKRDEYDFGSSSNSKGPIIHDITDICEDEVNLLCNSPIMTPTVTNVTSPNPEVLPETSSQINEILLPNSNQTVKPLNLLDPLQASIQELGLVADVDVTNGSEDINENALSVDNLLQSSLSTPPGSPSTSHINFFENNTNDTKHEIKDLVVSASNESDPSSTVSLNEHVNGIDAELDSLHKLLSESGLNIDTATLYGVGGHLGSLGHLGLEDFSFNSKLFSLDDPMMSSLTNIPMTSNDIIGNEVVQFNPANSNTDDLFDDILDTFEENVENVVVEDDCENDLNGLRQDSLKDKSDSLVS